MIKNLLSFLGFIFILIITLGVGYQSGLRDGSQLQRIVLTITDGQIGFIPSSREATVDCIKHLSIEDEVDIDAICATISAQGFRRLHTVRTVPKNNNRDQPVMVSVQST